MNTKSTFAHRLPEVEFWVEKRQETPADKIYLGLFLALCLFFAMLFGNLLFVVMVVILSLVIMLSYSTGGEKSLCVLGKDEISFEKQVYLWEDVKDFAIFSNQMDNDREYIRLSFRNYLNPHTYIPLPKNVQKETIYAILSAKLDESPSKNLSLAEMFMLRFFKW